MRHQNPQKLSVRHSSCRLHAFHFVLLRNLQRCTYEPRSSCGRFSCSFWPFWIIGWSSRLVVVTLRCLLSPVYVGVPCRRINQYFVYILPRLFLLCCRLFDKTTESYSIWYSVHSRVVSRAHSSEQHEEYALEPCDVHEWPSKHAKPVNISTRSTPLLQSYVKSKKVHHWDSLRDTWKPKSRPSIPKPTLWLQKARVDVSLVIKIIEDSCVYCIERDTACEPMRLELARRRPEDGGGRLYFNRRKCVWWRSLLIYTILNETHNVSQGLSSLVPERQEARGGCQCFNPAFPDRRKYTREMLCYLNVWSLKIPPKGSSNCITCCQNHRKCEQKEGTDSCAYCIKRGTPCEPMRLDLIGTQEERRAYGLMWSKAGTGTIINLMNDHLLNQSHRESLLENE